MVIFEQQSFRVPKAGYILHWIINPGFQW